MYYERSQDIKKSHEDECGRQESFSAREEVPHLHAGQAQAILQVTSKLFGCWAGGPSALHEPPATAPIFAAPP